MMQLAADRSGFCGLARQACATLVLNLTLCVPAAIAQECQPKWLGQFPIADLDGEVLDMAEHDDGTGPALYVVGNFNLAGGQVCLGVARWQDGFSLVGVAPTQGQARRVVAVDDDGPGPNGTSLIVAGDFTAGGFERVARWDGAAWSRLGGIGGQIVDLAVAPGPSGDSLYACGSFTTVSGAGGIQNVLSIARWTGADWVGVTGGVQYGNLRAICAHDDGTGPALFAAGDFRINDAWVQGFAKHTANGWVFLGGVTGGGLVITDMTSYSENGSSRLFIAGGFTLDATSGASLRRIARWDGTALTPVGTGVNGTVNRLGIFNGSLYLGGVFTNASGVPANRIARWNGSAWSAPASTVNAAVQAFGTLNRFSSSSFYAGGAFTLPGIRFAELKNDAWTSAADGPTGPVTRLRTADLGSGPKLYVGGEFASVAGGAVPAAGIASWNGTAWSPLGTGLFNGWALAMEVFDPGTGPALYVGGNFTGAGGTGASRLARWNGSAWSTVGFGVNGEVEAIATYDDGTGSSLYIGGGFTMSATTPVANIAKLSGTTLTPVGGGLSGRVSDLAVFDDGSGSHLYAVGNFSGTRGVDAQGIGSFSSTGQWAPLGAGASGFPRAAAEFGSGSSRKLIFGGAIQGIGGLPGRDNIGAWNGSSWESLGTGVSAPVEALLAFNDGAGDAVYAAGSFITAGSATVNRVARWNGSAWSSLDTGLGSQNEVVSELAVFDDGAGAKLYAGGNFTRTAGRASIGIAAFDGADWSTFGTGLGFAVADCILHDPGTGEELFGAGTFTQSPAPGISYIARWNGTSWAALGAGTNDSVRALARFNDGTGTHLFATGFFTFAGGMSANRIARWTPAGWSPLGAGLNGVGLTLAVHDDGSGEALYVGGSFSMAGGIPANTVARWNGVGWSAVGSGFTGEALRLVSADAGGGSRLYMCGQFSIGGGPFFQGVLMWDGATWTALSTLPSIPTDLVVHDDGSGPAIYVSGQFGVRRWDGASWIPVNGTFISGSGVFTLASFDADGPGPIPSLLFAGGSFERVDGVPMNYAAAWNGVSWSALPSEVDWPVQRIRVLTPASGPKLYFTGQFLNCDRRPTGTLARWTGSRWEGVGGATGQIRSLSVLDDGAGQALFVTGGVESIGGLTGPCAVAKWDGTTWTNFSADIAADGGYVSALATFDEDGSGPAPPTLFAGGAFRLASSSLIRNIARWNGAQWAEVAEGISNGEVNSLSVFDPDGLGPLGDCLIVGGSFNSVGGLGATAIAVDRMAVWTGSEWQPFRDGVDGTVNALTIAAPGIGATPRLFVLGTISRVNYLTLDNVARWDGTRWSGIGRGVNPWVRAIVVHDDGSGPALYIGGDFNGIVDAPTARRVAKLTPSGWVALGEGISSGQFVSVEDLASFDPDGTGPTPAMLIAAGLFQAAGIGAASNIAAWDGNDWSPLGTGISGGIPTSLDTFTDARGPGLFVGGTFTNAGGMAVARIGRWGCTERALAPCPGDADGDRLVGLSDIAAVITVWGQLIPPAPEAIDLDESGDIGLGDIAAVVKNWGADCR